MSRVRIPLLIALSICVIGIVFGSFFDLNISSAIASPKSIVGLTISSIGPTIAFGGIAVMGGGFVAFALQGKRHIVFKIIFFVLAVAFYVLSIAYPGGEYFGLNGFYGAAPEWVGYVIVFFPQTAAAIGGYFLFKDCENKNAWIVFCIAISIILLVLFAIIPPIKNIMHRPRYRLIVSSEVAFHNWWEQCKNYKELMALYDAPKENFKSYPSGHAAESSILFVCAVLLPVADPRYKKLQMPLFFGACDLVSLVMLARILAAAHFLSDVSWGAFIMLAVLFIANEIVIRVKPLHHNEIESKN